MSWAQVSITKRREKKEKNLQLLTATINRACLKTKLHIVSCWSLISARSGSQRIEADPILGPTQHWTAGVMASLWHNQKKRKKPCKKHASSETFFPHLHLCSKQHLSAVSGNKKQTIRCYSRRSGSITELGITFAAGAWLSLLLSCRALMCA